MTSLYILYHALQEGSIILEVFEGLVFEFLEFMGKTKGFDEQDVNQFFQ